MSSRLKSILKNPNRVRKKKAAPKSTAGGGTVSRSSSSWSTAVPPAETGTPRLSRRKQRHLVDDESGNYDDYNDGQDYFGDSLSDAGLVQILATDLVLRDVPQAMRYSRDHMFDHMPDRPSSLGLSSTQVADVLNYRRNLPPLVTVGHLQALLRSPTAVERETAELVRAGLLRKVVVPRGRADGGVAEFLVTSDHLRRLVGASGALDEGTKAAYSLWLSDHPTNIKLTAVEREPLTPTQIDRLVKGGFLATAHDLCVGSVAHRFAKPEDKGSIISLEAVSRAAAGSLDAVGGEGAVHLSGGSGTRTMGKNMSSTAAGGEMTLAVPGQGAYLKLVSAALSHLAAILAHSAHKEMPETLAREGWEGGVRVGTRQDAAKTPRREAKGVLRGRMKKWKQFYGVLFDWVLHEAVGAGLVEVFDTGSVGRGVRLLQ